MRKLILFGLVIFMFASFASAVDRDLIINQSIGTTTNNVGRLGDGRFVGASAAFMLNDSKSITNFSFYVSAINADPSPLNVSIMYDDGSAQVGSAMVHEDAEVITPYTSINAAAWNTVTFPSSIVLNASQSYHIIVITAWTEDNGDVYTFHFNNADIRPELNKTSYVDGWGAPVAAEEFKFMLYAEGAPPPPPAPDSLNISNQLPVNASEFNVQEVNFNVSYNASFEFNCSLFLNGASNQTTDNWSAGTNLLASWNVTFGATEENTYNYQMKCDDGLIRENTTITTVYIDNANPVLVVDSVLSSNRSISYRLINITSGINCSDTNLWGLNITVDGSVIIYNITGITGTNFNYNMSFNPNVLGLSIGVHNLTVEVSDSHTANSIPDYYYERNLFTKSITYSFGGGWIRVKPTNKGLFADFNTWKNKDRYAFEFERDLMGKILYGTDLEFEITSSHSLINIDSEFPGHIISPDLKKWIDFDSQYEDAIITTTKIDDRTFKVFIEGIENDTVVFNSLGGLNVIEENFTFYYGNFTESYESENVLETESKKFSINFTINDSFVEDIDATLSFDGTYYEAATKTSSSDSIYFDKNIASGLLTTENETNKSFFWNYTITNAGLGNNITDNSTTTKNQTIYKMIVSNCTDSIANTTAINYSVLDTIFDTAAYVVSEASFTVWNGSSSSTRSYGLNWDNSSSFNLCIWPNWATIYTNYKLLYTGYGDTNSRIRTNDTLDNITDYVTLYITTEGDDISINVVDENDNGLEDMNVEAWIYDISENNYTLVSEEETDPDGLAIMRLYTAGEDEYRFLIYDGVDLLFTSSRFKIYQTEYTFRIVLGTVPNSTLIELQSLDYTLTVDKTERNFTLIWNDVPTNLITNINLTTFKMNATGKTLLDSRSSTADSGTLEYNVTGGYGTYVAYVYVISKGDGLEYLLDSVSLDVREEWEIFGTDALIMSFFFIGTMIFTGLSFSGAIAMIAMIFGMIVFYALGFIQISLTGVVGIIISAVIILVRIKK